MTKNLKIQLFIDLDQYETIREAAITRKISYKNDSDMIRRILFDYTQQISSFVAGVVGFEFRNKKLLEENKQLQAAIDAYREQLGKKNNEVEILQHNLENLIEKKKRREG